MTRVRALLACGAFAWLCGVPGGAGAQLSKLTTSYVSDSAGVLPLKVPGKYLGQIKERDVLARSYEAAAPDNRISRKQYPNSAGLQMALDLLADDNPKARSAKPEEFVDARFIKELDDGGYIDSLYKTKSR